MTTRHFAGLTLAACLGTLLAVPGCRQREQVPPTPIPSADPENRRAMRDVPRPLPADAVPLGQYDPRFDDPPLLNLAPPEAAEFLAAYDAVGRPRIAVWVNRTLEGQIVPTTEERIISGRRRVLETDGDVEITRRVERDLARDEGGYYGGRGSRSSSLDEGRLATTGPSRIEERVETYIPAAEVDELLASRVDYEALENAMADALSLRGRVVVLSPQMVRGRLSADERRALAAGQVAVLDDLAERLGADILVHVQARPTAQSTTGLDLRIIAEALNTSGGEGVGRARADFSGPMSAGRLDMVSRYLARRLMDDMTGSWVEPPVSPPEPAAPSND